MSLSLLVEEKLPLSIIQLPNAEKEFNVKFLDTVQTIIHRLVPFLFWRYVDNNNNTSLNVLSKIDPLSQEKFLR